MAPIALTGDRIALETRRTAGCTNAVRVTAAASTSRQTPTLPTVSSEAPTGIAQAAVASSTPTSSSPGSNRDRGRQTDAATTPASAYHRTTTGDATSTRASPRPMSMTGTQMITG